MGPRPERRLELRVLQVVRPREVDPGHDLRIHASQPSVDPGPDLEPREERRGILHLGHTRDLAAARRRTAAIASRPRVHPVHEIGEHHGHREDDQKQAADAHREPGALTVFRG